MADSRRRSLQNVGRDATVNAGLWLARYRRGIPTRAEEQAARQNPTAPRSFQTAAELIDEAAAVAVPAPYLRFFEQWSDPLHAIGARLSYGDVDGRLLIGIGAESVLETNITLHRTFGVPFIPGSAIKGLLAAYIRRQLDPAVWGAGTDAWRILFGEGGDTGSAGAITYFDALPIYTSADAKPIEADVLTVHHPDYYNSAPAAVPADWDSPIPIALAGTTGRFLFAMSGPPNWLSTADKLLGEALEQLGIGAKTSSGYGRMRLSKNALQAGNTVSVRAVEWDAQQRRMAFSVNNYQADAVLAVTTIAEGQAIPAIGAQLRYNIQSRHRLRSGIILLTVVPQ